MYVGLALVGGQTSFVSAFTERKNIIEHGFSCKVYGRESTVQPAALDDSVCVGTLSLEEALLSFKYASKLPPVESCISVLQKCRVEKDLGLAKRLHMYICNNGLEALSALGDHLVPLFVECESFADAEHLFYTLGHPNECSWTAIIQGCVEEGKPQHALCWYEAMQADGVYPSKFTFVAVLRACTQLKYLEKGKEVYLEVVKEGFESYLNVGTTLLALYVRCGLVSEAKEVFDTLLVRDVISWNVLISGYIDYGHGKEALQSLHKMRLEGISPNEVTFLWILKACDDLEDTYDGGSLHAEIVKMGFETSPFVANTLIGMYAKCGLFADAWDVFDKLPVHGLIAWTAMISGYEEAGLGEEALSCLEGMKGEGIMPDSVASVCGLNACASLGMIEVGQKLHADVMRDGFEEDLYVGNTLVDMYSKSGLFAEAYMVLADMLSTDAVTWNALIAGLVEHELCEDGLKCLDQMQEEGVSPDAVSYICSLNACGTTGIIEKTREIHSEVFKRGFERMSSLDITLLEVYTRCGSPIDAQCIFDNLPALNVFSWNSMIAIYVEHGQGLEALRCLDKMQMQGVLLDDFTYACSLKACTLIGAEAMGLELHTELVMEGFEKSVFVGNCLVDMYAKLRFVTEAQEIFDELFVRDATTWAILVGSYVEHGLYEEALSTSELMMSESVSLNAAVFCFILKACSSLSLFSRGLEIHTQVILEGLEEESSLANTLVDMYAKCGLIIEAQEVFDELSWPDVVSWNSLTAGYAEQGLGEQALYCLDTMKATGVSPDAVTFLSVVKACGRLMDPNQAHQVYCKIMEKGFERDACIGNALLGMYLKCNLLEEAQHTFHMLSDKDIVAWNILIRGYVEHGFPKAALDCKQEMELEAISPNAFTFVCILKAYGKQGNIDIGRQLHTEILKEGFETDPYVSNILMDYYFKCGFPSEAQELFDELLHPSVISWNILIAGYTENGFAEEALECYEQMQHQGLYCDRVTYICSLRACTITGALDRGRHVHAAIISEGLDEDPFIGNALVNMYVKCGAFMDAHAVFDELLVQNVVSWNVLISGYADEHGVDALICLEEMQHDDVPQDVVTYICTLKACGMVEALNRGQDLHQSIVKKGLDADLFTGNALVDMYGKCGALAEARTVFDRLHVKDTSSWNTLLSGFMDHGRIKEFHECREEMRNHVQSDRYTHVISVMVCGGIGALDKGWEVHADIAIDGFERHPLVGNSLVDMYGKCGALEEAENVFDELVYRDVVSWTSLLAGYAEHGLIKRALGCLKDMQIHGVHPNIVSWNAVIMGCAEQKEDEKTFKLFAEMQEQCVLPSDVTFMGMLKACYRPEALVTGKLIHARIHRMASMDHTERMNTSIIYMYGQCSSMADAQQLFDALLPTIKYTASWNALIAGYVSCGETEKVFDRFDSMRKEGSRPDGVTFLSVLTACKQKNLLSKAQFYYTMMSTDYGIIPDVKHQCCMLDVLGRGGQLNQAITMLENAPAEPCLVLLCSSVLDACEKWGEHPRLEKWAAEKLTSSRRLHNFIDPLSLSL